MRIQLNSDKNISVDGRLTEFIEDEVHGGLRGFISRLTRVEVFLSDVNSHKPGVHDKRCVIEARPARHRPLVASSKGKNVKDAAKAALTKLRSSLQTFYGRMEGEVRSLTSAKRSAIEKKLAGSNRARRKRTPRALAV
jgi:hypothetical protein